LSTNSTEATSDSPETSKVTGVRRLSRRGLVEWSIVVVLALVVSLLLRTFVFQTFFVPSGSMEPTLWPGDRIIVNKLSVEFGTINIGDIMVFKAPPKVATVCDDDVKDLVKRVIGVPGDRLYSKGNTIFVNGKPLDQRWSHYVDIGTTPIKPITVPKNHYFMMGDNHINSCDSRYWGTVPKSSMIGKVFVRIWPIWHFRWF
jgi:signal peptidase I